MSEPKRHPLAGIDRELGEFQELAEVSFEEDTVKHLMSQLDLTHDKWKVLGKWKAETGLTRLTLPGFCRYYDTFPMSLRSLVTKISKSDRLSTLCKEFSRAPFLQQWKDLRDDEPRETRGRPFGVVVKWPYIPRGMVFHTLGDKGGNGLRVVYRDRKFELTGEPLDQLLIWLQGNWSR